MEHAKKQNVHALGLFSGGLDSILAARIVKDLGVEVQGIYFRMPWDFDDETDAVDAAKAIGIKLSILQLGEEFLDVIKKPQHGYGIAINPCIDCKIYMLSEAARFMRDTGADFLFTGEVAGQRPMSQRKDRMKLIEKKSGLEGKILRPLSAKLLEPTIYEKEGIVNRDAMLDFRGRSRKEQIKLAARLGITKYRQPAGGCLLTDKNFARRIKDLFKYGYHDFRETVSLKLGRHFRINKIFKAAVGRNEKEDCQLIYYADKEDIVMQLANEIGPVLILKKCCNERGDLKNTLTIAASLVQKFSKYKNEPPVEIKYYAAGEGYVSHCIMPGNLTDEQIEEMWI